MADPRDPTVPPPMVPSARERICSYVPLREAGVFIRDPAIAEVSKAYRDGWNAALAAQQPRCLRTGNECGTDTAGGT